MKNLTIPTDLLEHFAAMDLRMGEAGSPKYRLIEYCRKALEGPDVSVVYSSPYTKGWDARNDEINLAARQFTDQAGDPIIHAELTDKGWEIERPWGTVTHDEFTHILDEARGE